MIVNLSLWRFLISKFTKNCKFGRHLATCTGSLHHFNTNSTTVRLVDISYTDCTEASLQNKALTTILAILLGYHTKTVHKRLTCFKCLQRHSWNLRNTKTNWRTVDCQIRGTQRVHHESASHRRNWCARIYGTNIPKRAIVYLLECSRCRHSNHVAQSSSMHLPEPITTNVANQVTRIVSKYCTVTTQLHLLYSYAWSVVHFVCDAVQRCAIFLCGYCPCYAM